MMNKTNTAQENQDKKKLTISSSLTINDVSEFFEKHKDALHCNLLQIDASEVKQIDIAGLQLLLYFINSVKANNGNVEWDNNPTSAFLKQSELAGMAHSLSLKQGESP